MKIRLVVPQVKAAPVARPPSCPRCRSSFLHQHQRVDKAIIDTQIRQVVALRYRCLGCGCTFRHYPEGVCAYRQSQRLMGLAALLWALGLSMSAVSHVLHALEAGIHKSSVSGTCIEPAYTCRTARWPAGFGCWGRTKRWCASEAALLSWDL